MALRIAFAGPMCVGKTWCARYLESQYQFRRAALADPIKSIAYTYFGTQGKADKDRRVYQRIGSSFRQIDPDVWVKAVLRRIDSEQSKTSTSEFVIDDVRYLNEARILTENGFTIVRVTVSEDIRNERIFSLYGPISDKRRNHVSETESGRIQTPFSIESVDWNATWQLDNLLESLSSVSRK